MSLRPIVIEQFPGLDLRADPGESRGAIDALNVTLEAGRIRTRDGTVSHLSFTPAGSIVFAMPYDIGLILATVGAPGSYVAVDLNGASIASSTPASVTNAGMSGVVLGTPTVTYGFVAGNTTCQRFNGAAWATATGVGSFPATAELVSISPADNRLVVVEAAASTSKVWFSVPGDPLTYNANDFVRLDPGDSETFTGAATFNNQTFIFKQTKFFVFYGTSTDSSGGAIFNYRPVRASLRTTAIMDHQAFATGPDGVYFVASDGIYRTTGGAPVKVSQALDPFFTADAGHVSSFWQGGVWDPSVTGNRLCWFGDYLFASLRTSTATTLFVLNRATGTWTRHSYATTILALATNAQRRASPNYTQVMFLGNGTTLLRTQAAATDDAGTAIVSRYRLPFETYGQPGEKRIRETLIEGTGSPTLQWSRDWGALGTGSAVTLGTSPAVAVGRQRLAQRGRAFSLQLGAASGAWAVNRVQANIADVARPVSVTV